MFFYVTLLLHKLLFSGTNHHSRKKFKNNTLGDLFLKSRLAEQFEDSDATNEVLDFEEHKVGVAVFDDMSYSNQE